MAYHETALSRHNLPTPGNSTEILPGKRGSLSEHLLPLPPAAIAGHGSDSSSIATTSPVNSDSSYRPISPPANSSQKGSASRRKSSGSQQNNHAKQGLYSLPPPPQRTRKIIQMKPGQNGQEAVTGTANAVMPGPVSNAPQGAQSMSVPKSNPVQAGSKRKQQGSGNTAVNRKIARKTAHSLIERRRRSKMNEEFGVLKDMIPACRGQEMHKLAILQASIEYMKYLEQCLGELKSAHATSSALPQLPSFSHIDRQGDDTRGDGTFRDDEDEQSDEEMSEATSPREIRPKSDGSIQSHQPSMSPAILPSAQTSPEIYAKSSKYGIYGGVYQSRNHSARSSALPSPAFEPQTQASGPGGYNTIFAPLTSPALRPQGDILERDDHEATSALLMLNTDRRSWSSTGVPVNGRSMSVKDLLSG